MELKETRQKANLYKLVFLTEEGKKVLDDLAAVCGVDYTSFDSDALKMAYNEGLRAVYLYIKFFLDYEEKDEEKLKEAINYA